MATTKKKPSKMEPKLVAKDEVYYISTKFKVPAKSVRQAKKEVGVSRVKIYARLREMGYSIPTRKFPKK